MGLDFVSGQYGCLFSRCRKYVIHSLILGHFHIGLVIIPRPILVLDSVSGQYGGLGMITRPIRKCPCAYARELDVVCFLWALKYVKCSFFYTFRGTKSYKICDFIYHVMVISEIYDNLWCRNWHLMLLWFRKDKEQRNAGMVIISIQYLQR
jgi:hypothetical protein